MKNLTEGNPVKLMLSFALPVCIGNIFQLFYSLADTRIVGSVFRWEFFGSSGSNHCHQYLTYRLFAGTYQWICNYCCP